MPRERLGDILIKAGLLDEAGLQRALNEQQRWGGQLGRYLVELGLITEEILVRALSTQFKIPAVALDPTRLDIKTGRVIAREICERNNLVCFRVDNRNKFVDVAMSDPSNLDAIDEVRVATKYNVRPYIAAPTAIDRAISQVFYGDVTMGGNVDLSPDSSLRLDATSSSELLQRASLGRGEPPRVPRPQSAESGPPALDVKVLVSDEEPWVAPRPRPPRAAAPPVDVGPIELPSPARDDAFHITMDVPAVDKEDLAQKTLESRVGSLEALLERNTAVLKAMLEGLAAKGLFTKDEVRRILGTK